MNRESIIDNIEKLINGEIAEFKLIKDGGNNNAVDTFMENAAIRLINGFEQYQSGKCGISEYLVSIRNFMIVFQTPLRIENANVLDNNHFGIYKYEEGFNYYAAYDVPEFVKNKSFVESAFISASTYEEKTGSKYLLKTNGYIKHLTGFDNFKSIEQKLCVYGALNTPSGYTALVSMPTGGGKSLVTQTIGYEMKGLTIVVVPTVSLAIDQERAAKRNIRFSKQGEIFCYYSGMENFDAISNAIKRQTMRLLFISPEALIKNDKFKELIQQANSSRYIKNLIIDEAHIVAAWGDFFRVDYQCLGPWGGELLKVNPDIRTFLLSATFQDDTVAVLKKIFAYNEKWIEIRCDSLRKEPHFILVEAQNYHDKYSKVLELVNKLPRPMILYVDAPYAAKKWKDFLENYGYGNVKTFTGETESDERRLLIDQWADNKFELVIATSAFGVGVDKPDVRSVIHLYVPESPDTYYQELGRGGRDGLPCLSVVCIEKGDISRASKHVSKVLTTEKLWGRWWSMFSHPANQWQNGAIAILASTKPNYNKTNYFEAGNNVDEKWNINVLLLLNRYAQIKILNFDLDQENRYIFTVKILNDQITMESEETKKLFDDIREKESAKTQNSFGLIRNAIEKKEKLCWSTMFYDTYPLASEFCSGCNYHSNRVADKSHEFPLLDAVKGPEKVITKELKKFFSNTNEMLVILKEIDNEKEIIRRYLPDIVVCENVNNIEDILNPRINYMNFAEFSELQLHDNGFYISGLIMAIYSTDQQRAINEYKTMMKYLNKYRYVIHVSKKDFCISTSSGKVLSDQIDGTVIS